MKWNKFRLTTTTEAEDIVSSMLMDLGIQGVEIEDKVPLTQSDKEQMFVDILPETEADDGVAYLSFYLEEDEDKEKVLADVRAELQDMASYLNVGACTIEESQTEDVDWVNNWKQYFHQFYVDDILIIPSWEEVKPEDSDKMVIHIDPGTAFGTGMHETTQLCIRQIRKYTTPETTILDVGCGSGILGMLALKFGAKYSVGTDLDPCAIEATYENMEVNGISKEMYEVMIGNIIDDKDVQDKVGYGKYDIVVANILADVLVALTPVIVDQLKDGGIYITSGIIDDDTELSCPIYLFQGLPKGDKMEWIIQKCVELGVHAIVPVATKRAVVKLDEKKAQKKVNRWNAIAESAAKQSGRGIVPEVLPVMKWKEALEYARQLDVKMIPYEKAAGINATKQLIGSVSFGQSVGIFIGPEGGFEEAEVEAAKAMGAVPVTLGKRILRTETAGMTILSILMYHLERE